jgi:hypothetical protein
MKTINDNELNAAWELWCFLKELGDRLWQRYEQEFLSRSIEQEQQEALRSDSHDNEYPF